MVWLKEHCPRDGKGAADEEQNKGECAGASWRGLLFTVQQLLLPMVDGIVHSRQELFSWDQQAGIKALRELFEMDAMELAGVKGKHRAERA